MIYWLPILYLIFTCATIFSSRQLMFVFKGSKASSDGHRLYTHADTNNNSHYYGPASISNGVLYIGNFDGYLYAFGT